MLAFIGTYCPISLGLYTTSAYPFITLSFLNRGVSRPSLFASNLAEFLVFVVFRLFLNILFGRNFVRSRTRNARILWGIHGQRRDGMGCMSAFVA